MAQSLEELVGKQILATLTEIDNNGRILRRQELVGRLQLKEGRPYLHPANGSGLYSLPENPQHYEPADPQREFHLEESGGQVSGIDYTLTFVKGPPEFMQQP